MNVKNTDHFFLKQNGKIIFRTDAISAVCKDFSVEFDTLGNFEILAPESGEVWFGLKSGKLVFEDKPMFFSAGDTILIEKGCGLTRRASDE